MLESVLKQPGVCLQYFLSETTSSIKFYRCPTCKAESRFGGLCGETRALKIRGKKSPSMQNSVSKLSFRHTSSSVPQGQHKAQGRRCASTRDACGALPNLLRSVLQADELPIHIYLLDGHVPCGRGRVGNGHTAAGFRLLHVDPLPLAAGRADTAAGRGS